MSQRIYLDLEYCYPGMTRETGRPTEQDLRQIVQIAAIRYDHASGQELASFDRLTIPAYTEHLPEFFTELTGITQDQVDVQATTFDEALRQLVEFCAATPIYTFDKDWYVIRQNCTYFDMVFPFSSAPFTRVKSLLAGWGLDKDQYSSGTLFQAAGLAMDGHVHNALHDVRSMAAATRHFDR